MPSAAVSAALPIDVSWAKKIASDCQDSEVKKVLWLYIAKFLIQSEGRL